MPVFFVQHGLISAGIVILYVLEILTGFAEIDFMYLLNSHVAQFFIQVHTNRRSHPVCFQDIPFPIGDQNGIDAGFEQFAITLVCRFQLLEKLRVLDIRPGHATDAVHHQ